MATFSFGDNFIFLSLDTEDFVFTFAVDLNSLGAYIFTPYSVRPETLFGLPLEAFYSDAPFTLDVSLFCFGIFNND